jgi:hypothetical protein
MSRADKCPGCGGKVKDSRLPFSAPLTLGNCWLRCQCCARRLGQTINRLFATNNNPVKK